MLTPIAVENLRILRDAVEKHPEELLDLEGYVRETACGTLYCTAGLASTIPHFQKQGMRYNSEFGLVTINGAWLRTAGYNPADEMFGPNAYENLFHFYGGSPHDEILFNSVDAPANRITRRELISDKRLALHRIDRQLEEYGPK